MSQPGFYPVPRSSWANPPRKKPSGWWIVAGVVLIVAGVAGAITFGVMSVVRMNDQVNQFQRVAVPGSGDLRLEAGDYRIYFEYADDGTVADPSLDAAVRLTDPAARPVDLRAANGTSYQMGSHNGQSEFTFHADEAGVYRLTAQGSPNVTVAVGGNLITSIMRTILVPLALGFGGFIAGIAIIVTVVIRGARSQRPPAGSRSGPFAY